MGGVKSQVLVCVAANGISRRRILTQNQTYALRLVNAGRLPTDGAHGALCHVAALVRLAVTGSAFVVGAGTFPGRAQLRQQDKRHSHAATLPRTGDGC
jgi:hypothetical protein